MPAQRRARMTQRSDKTGLQEPGGASVGRPKCRRPRLWQECGNHRRKCIAARHVPLIACNADPALALVISRPPAVVATAARCSVIYGCFVPVFLARPPHASTISPPELCATRHLPLAPVAVTSNSLRTPARCAGPHLTMSRVEARICAAARKVRAPRRRYTAVTSAQAFYRSVARDLAAVVTLV